MNKKSGRRVIGRFHADPKEDLVLIQISGRLFSAGMYAVGFLPGDTGRLHSFETFSNYEDAVGTFCATILNLFP